MAEVEFDRAFQEEDVPFFLTHPKSMILYEPRLGKTPVTCRLVAQDPKTKVVLVCCSKNALSVWLDHFIPWWNYFRGKEVPLYVRFVRGNKAQREALWSRPIPGEGALIYLVTWEAYLADWDYILKIKLDTRIDTLIGDEVQRKLRNRNNKTVAAFKKLVRSVRRFHALSGTLAGKWGPADYWTILNMIKPQDFSSYWRFVDQFCWMADNGFGKEIVGVRNIEAFHLILSQYAKIRKRKDVAPQMPAVQRAPLWVEPSREQSTHYKELGKTSFTITAGGNIVVAENSLEKHIRKRQLLTCPRILDPSLGIGSAFEDLVNRLEEARDDEDVAGYHVAIFTTFRAAIPHFTEYLRSRGFNDIGILVGGTEPEDVVRTIEAFRAKRGIILGTTQFAQAFSLTPATVCYHIGYDYNPDNNKQAEDRLVPQKGINPIQSWYYGYKGTDDEEIIDVLTVRDQIQEATTTDPRLHVYHPPISLEGFITTPAQNTSMPKETS